MIIPARSYKPNLIDLKWFSKKARRSNRGGSKTTTFEEVEACFAQCMQAPLEQAERIKEADIVVGIPFYNEAETIATVAEAVGIGLERYFPDQKCVIVAAGAPAGGKALQMLNDLSESGNIRRIEFLLEDRRVNGKGWSMRAIMAIADKLGADLVMVEADAKGRHKNGDTGGLSPEWIKLLIDPIRNSAMDLVVARFKFHYNDDQIGAHLCYPLLAGIYNCPIHSVVGGHWGVSHSLVREYLKDPLRLWVGDISGYGVDMWMATMAITSGAKICEANLGIKIHKPSAAKAEMVSRQLLRVLFDQIVADRGWWKHEGDLLRPLAIANGGDTHQPDKVEVDLLMLILKYKQGFDKYHRLYKSILPSDVYQGLEELARASVEEFKFSVSYWPQIVYGVLLAYAFRKDFAKDDLISSLISLHAGFSADFALRVESLKSKMTFMSGEEIEGWIALEADRETDALRDLVRSQKPGFLASWECKSEALKPTIPQITYREFIPGVPLIVPSELTNSEGKKVYANDIYNAIFAKQKQDFEYFAFERLQISRDATSGELAIAVKDLLHLMEDTILPGCDLTTLEGTNKLVRFTLKTLPHGEGFSLIPDVASWILHRYPPYNLHTKLDCKDLAEVLQRYDPLDVLALASWSEDREYLNSVWKLIVGDLRSEHFASCSIKPLVVSHDKFPSLVEMKDSSALNKLTSRIVISNLHKGMGGEFPKIRYLTTLSKNIVEAERFGDIWRRFAEERKEFGRKVASTIEGHWGREPLSAHSIFEDGNQRELAKRFRQVADKIAEDPRGQSLSENLKVLADSYNLALVLHDGTFVTCSAWSWASHSFKGGKSSPSPLSLHVERNWTSREFLVEYYKAAGGTEQEVEEKVIELMGQGREWENLAPIILGAETEDEHVIPQVKLSTPDQPTTGVLTRYEGNPILEPIKEHSWESKYVLNAGTIKLNGRVFLVYRAFGDDEVSRLGLAASTDGFLFNERLDTPIFEPKGKSETHGCEDPRLTLIDDRVFMAYTAYDGMVAQIALASINVKDFMNYRWGAWRRHGLVFPGYNDKDAAMFPDQFNGKYAMLHRVEPHMWVTFSSHLRCPWPRKEHKILAGSTAGMMWDANKIGAGAQPIKTKYGWLLVTHGVDYALVYRLGVMLLDLNDPRIVLYRSPNPVLEPLESCELGEPGTCWVPNVVFTCGLVARESKEVLDAQDEVLVYFGAADTVIGVATAKIGDLIPEEFR